MEKEDRVLTVEEILEDPNKFKGIKNSDLVNLVIDHDNLGINFERFSRNNYINIDKRHLTLTIIKYKTLDVVIRKTLMVDLSGKTYGYAIQTDFEYSAIRYIKYAARKILPEPVDRSLANIIRTKLLDWYDEQKKV